uniref:Smith-Magenis syndrome chromosomal region candidate gene 8 protein homolog n=1 Tax=Poecilia reticulata TaxID=8081 RepID=A0A3P9MS48_POERE
MIGSPDLLPFTGSGGFEEEGEEPEVHTLPEEFSVRLLPPHNPWSTAAQFHRDFILVAEFSEQVGPKPVLTIPNNPKVIGSFDLNHFSVRIMSVDYQASGPGHTAPASPGPRLNFSEDSRVILGDSADDSFAYVHHLTLYDLEARGMVRPFCMAYVCSDQSKLMENFSELSECFSQASDSLKTGNRQAFSSELQRKLALLQDTHSSSASTGAGGRADELEALEHLILNHRELLRQVTSYPNRKLQQPDFLPYDTAYLPSEPSSPCLPSTASCRSESLLKPLEELCNSYFLSLVKNQLADTEQRLRGDRSVLRTDRVSQLLSRKLKLTNFLFELCCPVDAEEEEEEDEAERLSGNTVGAVEGQSEKHAEELFSCVEEIQIKMEGGGGGRTTPDPSASTDMMGSVSSSDSIEVLGTEKSYRSQRAVVSDSRGTRTNSEDSIEVLSTTESIVPDDLSAITEEEAEHHTLTNGFEEEEESEAGCKPDEVLKERMKNTATAGEERDQSGGRKERLEEIIFNVTEKDNSLTEKNAVESRQKKSRPVFDLHVKIAPKSVLAEVALRTPPCGPVRLLSVDEFSDCTSFTSSSEPPSPTTVNLTSTCVDKKRKRRRAGLRALRFIKQLSFSQHAIFCLLIGRPLVVIGGDEQLVRKLVDGLRLFLPAPGADGSAVISCLATPLQLTDLLTWRLIGIHRSSSSASSSIFQSLTHLSRYIALLDLDQKTLRCPSYAGSLVGFLANPHTGISRGLTYLLHLESCLTELANRVLLQTFTAASQRYRAIAEEKDSQQAPQLCSSENDFRVMHFLTDLITQRHTGHGPPPFRFSYSSVQLHRNTYPT